ncbi:MAG TPA: hypothetical protein QF665_01585 [Alphaproteobacteria bacterium]|nr:hypothetical protein [Alphaproteobacteria bacterium]
MTDTKPPVLASDDPLDRARGYPYDLRGESFILYEGNVLPARNYEVHDMKSRTAVLAIGSNAAPSQLKRKFAETLEDEMIPVYRAVLPDFDAVFSARFSKYGAIPAALAPSKGTTLEAFVVCLNKAQLRVMHATELASKGGGYHFGRIGGLRALVDQLGVTESLHVYHAPGGALEHEGSMIALADVPAHNRSLPARDHADLWEEFRAAEAPGESPEAFAARLSGDAGYRKAQSAVLEARAVQIRLPRYTKLLPRTRRRR